MAFTIFCIENIPRKSKLAFFVIKDSFFSFFLLKRKKIEIIVNREYIGRKYLSGVPIPELNLYSKSIKSGC